jgi:hypothetical protein
MQTVVEVVRVVREIVRGYGLLQVVRNRKEEVVKMSEWFLDTVARLESVVPGMVFGTVDVVCRACGEASSLNCNVDGSNTYVCPNCGVTNDL